MPRKLLITMEVEIDHLPSSEIDDIESYAEETGQSLQDVAAEMLAEADVHDVAECLIPMADDPELFAGSSLYLKVIDTKVTSAKWADAA
jgi:hypothetical protein